MDCLRKKCENVAYKCECGSVHLCKDHIADHLSTVGSHKVGNIDAEGLISSFEEVCRLVSSQQAEVMNQASMIVDYVLKISLEVLGNLKSPRKSTWCLLKR